MKEMSMRDKFIDRAAEVLQRLAGSGHEAFLVGGCVREALRWEQTREEAQTLRGEPAAHGALQLQASDGSPAARIAADTDLDVTTDALPEEVWEIFADLPVIETGMKHGTVTVLVAAAADAAPVEFTAVGRMEYAPADRRVPVEITTYRTDGEYSDGRHPDQVRFVRSLNEDLARRDFTVNAMAMDLRGRIVDPFGGQADLRQGIIRAVGDPETRFREDGLRILRALRFAAVLDFEIEPVTEAALFSCAPLLKKISAERIFVELKKLVCGPAAGRVVRRYADILGVVIPEILAMKGFAQNNPYHKYDVLEHCIRAMEAVRVPGSCAEMGSHAQDDCIEIGGDAPGSGDALCGRATAMDTARSAAIEAVSTEKADTLRPVPAYLKLAALLHDVGKPLVYTEDEEGIGHFYGHPQAGAGLVRRILGRLKTDRAAAQRIETLVHYHDLVFQEDDRLLKRWMNRYTPEVLLEILAIKRADNIATGNVSQDLLDKFDRIERMIYEIRQEAERGQTCFCMKDLSIGGKDLLQAGIPEGPQIGKILQELLDRVIDGDLPNEREALLAAVEML